MSSARSTERDRKPLPSADEIADIMYDVGLDSFCGAVVKTFYTPDRSKRFVVIRRVDGFYSYVFERLTVFDEEEWEYEQKIYADPLPAYWLPRQGDTASVYEDIQTAERELRADPDFKTYFVAEVDK